MASTGVAGGTVTPGRLALWAVVAAAVGVALWLASRYSYLLFHSLAETFAVVIAATVFLFSWSARVSAPFRPFALLGTGYLFVGIIEVLHMLAYEGMPIFPAGRDYATRLWIAARALQASVTLVFALALAREVVVPTWAAFTGTGLVATALVLSILWWDIFPICLVPGVGVTPFKRISEYVISGVLAVSALILGRRSVNLPPQIRRLLISAFLVSIASELFFTLYVDAYGYPNLIGHYLMVMSFYLSYQALFAVQVRARVELIERLEATDRELREANLAKDRFVSILAHDLRSPLGGLLNVSELLARRFDRLDVSTMRKLAESIYDATRHSADLLESVLQWARANTGKLLPRPSPVDLAELCRGILELNRGPAEMKSIRLRCAIPEGATVTADENMLATVLRNLVSNALKFTPRCGEVVVGALQEGAWQNLTVRDTGVGMGPDEVQKLFRIDTRYHREGTEHEPGHGMGLILCRELVTLNHGEMAVSSEPGRGSVFTVRLPVG